MKHCLETLRNGIRASDGEFLRAKTCVFFAKVSIIRGSEIILDEGKNRHIRRMLEHLNVEVLRLLRVAIGPLLSAICPKAATRLLDEEEKQALDRAMGARNHAPASSAR